MGQRGLLITVCGIDGSGKSTLVQRLAAALSTEHTPVETMTPLRGDANFVAAVRRLRANVAAHEARFAAASEQFLAAYFSFTLVNNVQQQVIPALEQGKTLICDRYLLSHRVNQMVLGNDLEPFTPLFQLCPKPDIAFFIDVSVTTALRRIAGRRQPGAFDYAWFLEAARSAFQELAPQYGAISLDGEQNPETLVQQALAAIRGRAAQTPSTLASSTDKG